MARKYFGTDGVRGKAGIFPLDPFAVRTLGRAAGRILGGAGKAALLGMDTRFSGPPLAASLASGLAEEGTAIRYAGVLPTAGVAHLTASGAADFGAMITASHNPCEDNGIKFFSREGFKLPDEVEEGLEAEWEALLAVAPAQEAAFSLPPPNLAHSERYLEHLLESWSGPPLAGWLLAVDGAHGAAYELAPQLFEALGAKVVTVGCAPSGRNINEACGSLHLGLLIRCVRESGAAIGFAFDGDADRCLAVTPSGRVLDGDFALYHEGRRRKANGSLGAGGVVGTVMSNLWLERALEGEGIPFHRAPVGDRYVLQALRERGGILGGEPSGHVLFLDRATTGDGLLTAMSLAEAARELGGAEALGEGIVPYPQVLRNLRVQRRLDLDADETTLGALERERAFLGERGRIILRFSGTEALLRLMVEAETEALVGEVLDRLTEVLYGRMGRG